MTHKSNHVYEVLREAAGILNSVPEIWRQTCEDMKYVDLETSDIMHELELEEFDKDKGDELAREIKKVRQRRRIVKEDQSAFSYLKDFCEKNGTFAKRLDEVVSLMEREIDFRSKRIYTPKIRKDKMSPIYAENAIRDEQQPHIPEEVFFIEPQPAVLEQQTAVDF
jgi:hypothetical protein